ncbi:hypothetical protein BC938DRAFT_480953 [Jimgerdemannia flammicorona]|uniref:Uncharacterized protein n=1 Tax=Jimgerdemannia flammicorona TaxID=994334 RepID=A0A433R0G4_9FUNG|nr:hypothetical protein BC938DRAFT_480953 [Jimgerdemannia flammicorona]
MFKSAESLIKKIREEIASAGDRAVIDIWSLCRDSRWRSLERVLLAKPSRNRERSDYLKVWPGMMKDDPYIVQFVTDVMEERIRSGTRLDILQILIAKETTGQACVTPGRAGCRAGRFRECSAAVSSPFPTSIAVISKTTRGPGAAEADEQGGPYFVPKMWASEQGYLLETEADLIVGIGCGRFLIYVLSAFHRLTHRQPTLRPLQSQLLA